MQKNIKKPQCRIILARKTRLKEHFIMQTNKKREYATFSLHIPVVFLSLCYLYAISMLSLYHLYTISILSLILNLSSFPLVNC